MSFFRRRRLRASAVLRDVQNANQQADPSASPPVLTVPGDVGSSGILPGALYGPHYAEVRNVIEIPFDDSLDSSFPLECFFQMPVGTTRIHSAKVWVQQKPFRMYSSAASAASGGGTLTSTGSSHTHGIVNSNQVTQSGTAHSHGVNGLGNQSATHTHDASSAEAQNHTHSNSGTATESGHTHNYSGPPGITDSEISPGHTHTVESAHAHTITLTPGIFESGPSGTFSIQVADDGTTYGAAIVSGATSATGLALTGLTTSIGDKRIKLTATGLQRAQILVVLDILVQVVLP